MPPSYSAVLTVGSCPCVQGSTISTLLCSIFLGHLEQMHLLPLLSCQQAATSPKGSSLPGLTALAQAAGPPLGHELFFGPHRLYT